MHNNSYCIHPQKAGVHKGQFNLSPAIHPYILPLIWPTLTPAPTFAHKTQNPYEFVISNIFIVNTLYNVLQGDSLNQQLLPKIIQYRIYIYIYKFIFVVIKFIEV